MADEQIQEEIKEEVVDDAQVKPDETPEVKLAEPTGNESGVEETPEPIEEEEAPEEGKEAEQPPSRREQLRIQQLLAKYGPPPERRSAPSQKQNVLDYEQALDADPEVIQQLEADRRAYAQSEHQRGSQEAMRDLQFMEYKNNIRFDLPLVSEKLSKVDPRIADAIDRKYLQFTGFNPSNGTVANPNVGYADFVEAELEFGQEVAKSMSEDTVRNVAKQSAQTGLRPDGSSAKRLNLNQAPEDMSLEELYAKIGQKPPKKS